MDNMTSQGLKTADQLTSNNLTAILERRYSNEDNSSTIMLIAATFVLFTMFGHGMKEAGMARCKNTTAILTKTIICLMISALAYCLIGFALSFGDGNFFVGFEHFAAYKMDEELYTSMFINYVLSTIPAIVACAAMTERSHLMINSIYTFFICSFIYPVLTHWVWTDQGWLNTNLIYFTKATYKDFGGSGVIYVPAGILSLMAAVLIRPRLEAFHPITKKRNIINVHSTPLIALGNIFVIIGMIMTNFLGEFRMLKFADGATSSKFAKIIVNSLMAMCAGLVISIIIYRLFKVQALFLHFICSGAMAGLVCVAGSCDTMPIWASIAHGVIGSILFTVTRFLLISVRVDDPLNCVSIHTASGLVGVITSCMFERNQLGDNSEGFVLLTQEKYPNMREQLITNLISILAIIVWCLVNALALLIVCTCCNCLRIKPHQEVDGLDSEWYGGEAYPNPGADELIYQRNYDHGASLSSQILNTTIESNFSLNNNPSMNAFSKGENGYNMRRYKSENCIYNEYSFHKNRMTIIPRPHISKEMADVSTNTTRI